jgi:hypothetical protein
MYRYAAVLVGLTVAPVALHAQGGTGQNPLCTMLSTMIQASIQGNIQAGNLLKADPASPASADSAVAKAAGPADSASASGDAGRSAAVSLTTVDDSSTAAPQGGKVSKGAIRCSMTVGKPAAPQLRLQDSTSGGATSDSTSHAGHAADSAAKAAGSRKP